MDSAIKVNQVTKSFRLPHEKHNSIKSLFVNFFKHKRSYEKQKVLNNISIDIKRGEFFGVIGRNGSGKSTLLKLLAGIYSPDKGQVVINGKLTPFIELGVGFNPELTGRENVYLNGALLGFNRRQMNKMYKEIVDFAELDKFMDQKLKNYSSGMQVRLAFSIAIRAKSDILLLDEVLAVGDLAFQEKCYKYFEKLKRDNQTVVFISHDSGAIEQFCDRVAIIDKSNLVDIGEPRDMVLKYGAIIADKQYASKKGSSSESSHKGSGDINIKGVRVLDANSKSISSINFGEAFTIRADYTLKKKIEGETVVGVDILDEKGISVIGPNTKESKEKVFIEKSGSIEVAFPASPISPGTYTVTVGIFNSNVSMAYDLVENAAQFKIIGEKRHGKIYIKPEWSITENK